MKKIGLISDTHGYLDPQVYDYFEDRDEIWHAGDFGPNQVDQDLASFKPLVGVYGNIDDRHIRNTYPEHAFFTRENLTIWMTHIGGYPGKYASGIRKKLKEFTPDIFVCGHSHILKVMPDKEHNNMLALNPGAAGNEGFHKVRTLLTFELDSGKIKNMKAIELGKRGKQP